MFEPTIIIEKARLTGEPVVKNTNGGNPFVTLNVAVNPGYYSQDKEWVDLPSMYYSLASGRKNDVKDWETLHKGDVVTITGKLSKRTYTDRNGNEREGWQINYATIGLRQAAAPSTQPQQPSQAANLTYGAQPTDPWSMDDMEF